MRFAERGGRAEPTAGLASAPGPASVAARDQRAPRPPCRLPDPDRVLRGVAGGFAIWTVLCHAMVLLGGSLDQLIGLAAAVVVVVMAVRWIIVRPPSPAHPEQAAEADVAPPPHVPLSTAAAATAAGVAAPLLAATGHPLGAWTTALAALTVAVAALVLRSADQVPRPAPSTSGVWALAAVMAAVAMSASRPDIDDALYLNLAVGAVDHPAAPLLAVDHMHGVAGVPLDPPTYRFHSLEPAVAAAARLTGVAPIAWAHLVLPPVAAVLMVLAWARLARLVAPSRWRETLVALLTILVVVGNTHHWYGNFGVVRLHQGKGLLVSIGVPLLLAAAAELVRRPDCRRLRRLAAAVVATVGLTGSALWLTPALVVVGLATGGLPRRGGGRAAVAAALAALYPLLLGLAIIGAARHPDTALAELIAGRAAQSVATPSAIVEPGPTRDDSLGQRLAPMRFAASWVLGNGMLKVLVAATVIGLWWLSPEPAARRLATTSGLLFLAVHFNPLLSLWLSDHVTGRPTYWRGFWLVPVPLLLALATTAAVVRLRRHGRLVAATATILLLIAVTEVPLLGTANRVRLAPFALKVPAIEYAIARQVVAAAPPGAAVIAPQDVAAWITTFRHHPCPLLVRRIFFAMLARAIPAEDARRREWAAGAVESPRLDPVVLAAFADALDRYRVAVVVLPRANPNLPVLRSTLTRAGYAQIAKNRRYQVWQRPWRDAPSDAGVPSDRPGGPPRATRRTT